MLGRINRKPGPPARLRADRTNGGINAHNSVRINVRSSAAISVQTTGTATASATIVSQRLRGNSLKGSHSRTDRPTPLRASREPKARPRGSHPTLLRANAMAINDPAISAAAVRIVVDGVLAVAAAGAGHRRRR